MSGIIEDVLRPHVKSLEKVATDYGLTFCPVEFILTSSDEMSALAAYGGFPRRYPHYSWGQEYEGLKQQYSWGLGKIYEMVINSDPSYAYLMKCNDIIDQKLVMAHVYGHVDFFTNNFWFSKTNKQAVDMMANHAIRVKRIIDRVGVQDVEVFIDMAHSVSNLIDPFAQYNEGFMSKLTPSRDVASKTLDPGAVEFTPHRHDVDHPDMDQYVNPDRYISSQRSQFIDALRKSLQFPEDPEADILAFLICHGKMPSWQKEILAIIREEAYYYAPQAMTKIMNEGWASYWHNTIMETEADAEEVIDYCSHNAGTLHWRKGTLNPYALGLRLLRHVEDKWDKGKFGTEWEECTDRTARESFDRKINKGRDKLFEIRSLYNDAMFLHEFMDREFVANELMFIYSENPETGEVVLEENDWEVIRDSLIQSISFRGSPRIVISNGNHGNRGELLLEQDINANDGEVYFKTAQDVLSNIARMWGRPVTLTTPYWDSTVDPGKLPNAFDGYISRAFKLT